MPIELNARVQFKHRRRPAGGCTRTLYNCDPDPRYGGGFFRGVVTSIMHGVNPVLCVLWDGEEDVSVVCYHDVTLV